MSRYNVNSPCALGPEWFPTIEGSVRLDGDLVAAGAVLTSSATEDIDAVWVALSTNVGDLTGFELEIYDATDLPTNVTAAQIFRPGCDFLKVDSYGWDGASLITPAGTLYTLIDEAVMTPGTYNGRPVADVDWISPIFGAGAQYACGFDSIAGSVTGQNVVGVTLTANCAELLDRYLVEGGEFVPFVSILDQTFFGKPTQVVGSGPGFQRAQEVSFTWWANPSTGVSWKPQDIDEFDCAGGSSAAGWVIKPTGTSNNLAVIFQGWLEVTYLDETDKRIAVGSLAPPSGEWGWQSLAITEPDGTPGWAKVNATEYLFLFRRRVGSGFVDWRFLADLTDEPGDPAWQRIAPRLFRQTFTLARRGDDARGAYGILLERDDAAMSVDSQPYRSINDDNGPRVDHEWTPVNVAVEVEQDIVTVGADDYGWARWLCAWASTRPTADLEVSLHRRSDDLQFGTTITLSPDDLVPPQTGFQVGEGEFGPVALAAATGYYLKWASTADADAGWRVQVMSTLIATEPGGPPVAAYDQTFGGTTETAWVDGIQQDSLDACGVIYTQDDPVADVAAAEVAYGSNACLTAVELSWTPASEGDCGAFLLYEIERWSPFVEAWQRIGELAEITDDSFIDLEAIRLGEVEYRIRTRRVDGSASPWTLADPLERTPSCCGFVFASNEARTYALWIDDVVGDSGRRWVFPDVNSTEEYYGRDFAVTTGALEQGGDAFDLTLVVASDGGANGTPAPLTLGPAEFDALRYLTSNKKVPLVGTKLALSYVAVTDSYGNQWLASVVPSGANFQARGGNTHTIEARVRQVTDVPSVVETGA